MAPPTGVVRLVPDVNKNGDRLTVPTGGVSLAITLPPVILPVDDTVPPVKMLPPVTLPVKLAVEPTMVVRLAVPAVVMLPPVMLPVALSVVTEKAVKLVRARLRSNNVIVVPPSLDVNWN